LIDGALAIAARHAVRPAGATGALSAKPEPTAAVAAKANEPAGSRIDERAAISEATYVLHTTGADGATHRETAGSGTTR
jgi:hypothetical protein